MTDPSRINWPAGLTPGVRYIPVVLVAGVPVVLVPSGCEGITTVATTNALDPLWWTDVGSLTQTIPGGSINPVKGWLDPSHVWEVFTEARLVEGDVRVEALTFDAYDKDGAATAELSVREGRTTQLLGAEIDASDTTIPLGSTSGVASSGLAAIGRETIIYDGLSAGSLQIVSSPAGRGRFGSRARAHLCPVTHPPLVSFGAAGGHRHWQGRLATVWVAKLSTDGTTITDPTPIYAGIIGAGVQLVRGGMRWSIPLDSVTEVSRKITRRTVDLFGFAHFAADFTQPLQVGWDVDVYLDGQSATPHSGGWHPDWPRFVDAWQDRAATVSSGSTFLRGSRECVLYFTGVGSDTTASIYAAWDRPVRTEAVFNPSGTLRTHTPPPEACLHLDGRVRIPVENDFAKIPSTLSWATSSGPDGTAYLTLTAKTRNTERLVARITARDGTAHELTVRAQLPASMVRSEDRQQATVITERTQAMVSVVAEGSSPLGALRAAGLALDELQGASEATDLIDWDDLARVFGQYPTTIPQARAYALAEGDTLLALLVQECRLRGMALSVRYGRITAYRPASFARTEPTRATITKTDVLVDRDTGELAEWEVIDNTQPLATSVSFELPDGTKFVWVDTTFADEFGDGGEIACTALKHLPPDVDVSTIATGLQAVAWQLLGPTAEPSRLVRLPLPPTFLHLQPGDLVTLSHDMVPSWAGTRGVSDVACQIVETRKQLWGGSARAIVGLRLQSEDLAGYAPEALVAASGLDHASHVVTLDTSSGWGPSCFARDVDVNGLAVADPLDGFTVGDKVVLCEIDSESPIADEGFTITAFDTTAHTVTLSGFPSVAMTGLAAAQYKVVLRFALWATCTATQQRYAFIADHTSGELGSGDPAKRWAA
jgi:hypothetical protein